MLKDQFLADDLVSWHKENTELLDHQFCGNLPGVSWPSALLFSGMSGLGKASFARLLSKKLFCVENQHLVEKSGLHMPCEACQGCHLFKSDNHPDFLEVGLVENNQQIKVEQLRQVISFLSLSPQIASLKIIMINQVEQLNENAANALLKSLEEPPSNSLFVLTTNNINLVKATVKSRCRILRFVPPDTSKTLAWLKHQGCDIPDAKYVNLLADMLGGSPYEIKQALEKNLIDKLKHWSMKLRGLHRLTPFDAIRLYQDWSDESFEHLLTWTQFWLLGRIKNNLSAVTKKHNAEIKQFFLLLDLVVEKKKLLSRSPQTNVQLMFLDLVHQWGRITKGELLALH